MQRYDVVLVSADDIRLSGMVTADTVAEAVATVERQTHVSPGDRLLLGVAGFPPLQLECTGLDTRSGRVATRWRACTAMALPAAVPLLAA